MAMGLARIRIGTEGGLSFTRFAKSPDLPESPVSLEPPDSLESQELNSSEYQ